MGNTGTQDQPVTSRGLLAFAEVDLLGDATFSDITVAGGVNLTRSPVGDFSPADVGRAWTGLSVATTISAYVSPTAVTLGAAVTNGAALTATLKRSTFTAAAWADIPGLTINFVAGIEPVELRLWLPATSQTIVNGTTYAGILDSANNVQAQANGQTPSAGGACGSLAPRCVLDNLTPGSTYLFKASIYVPFTGISTPAIQPKGWAPGPAYLMAQEI